MALQKVHLALELGHIRPAVVPLAEGGILAPGVGEEDLVVDVPALGVQVLLEVKAAYLVGVLRFVLPDDGGGAVGGDVVADQDLIGKIRLLAHHAVQGLADIVLVIVGGAEHRDHDGCFHAVSSHSSGAAFRRFRSFLAAEST